MWLYTKDGFISAVMEDSGQILARSRDLASLMPLASETEGSIKRTPLADYPYRTIVSRTEFAAWLLKSSLEIDYLNFKSTVASTRGHEYSDVLMKVWSVMHEVEDGEARARIIL